jgi:uncharacterized repeat protein (TIGR01451 family)
VDTIPASTNPRKRAGIRPVASVLCALLLALPGLARADKVDNTAQVTYQLHAGPAVTVATNTVTFEIIPLPSAATLSFLRYDPDASDGSPIAIDGGQCRVDSGSFAPLPDVTTSEGDPLDQEQAQTSAAPGYYTGDPIVVAVTDVNRNTDASVREYVDVDITTTTGDAETLRLQETGPDTGTFAGAIQSVAMPPAATQYDCVLSLAAYAQITARYTDTDFPLDALAVAATGYAPLDQARAVIRLAQAVSKDIVSIGDFIQYTLVVSNIHDAPATNARIRDVLPAGVRFRAGSLRVGNPTSAGDSGATPTAQSLGATSATRAASRVGAGLIAAEDPRLSADGRTLRFPVGNLAPGESVTATFVAEVGAGTSGQYLLNYAIASADGSLSSNETDSVVRLRDALATGRFTIIGRVLAADSCNAPLAARKGVPNVRLLLEDGTYAATDADGAYHIEGVRPGTHVLQVDPASVPADLEVVSCVKNTRFAGRADSQFVEAQGGMMWRGDFFLRKRPPVTGAVGVRLQLAPIAGGIRNTVDMDGGKVPVDGLRVLAILPPGATVVPGSSKSGGAPIPDPEVKGNFVIFRLGDPGADWQRQVVFDTTPGQCGADGYAGKVSALFSAAGENGRTPTSEAGLRCVGSGPGDDAATGKREEAVLTAAAETLAASAHPEGTKEVRILDDATAAGVGVDWLRGLAPGRDWLFPAADYNPRAGATRVVIKHMRKDSVALRINGAAVEPIRFDGRSFGPGDTAISKWTSVHLADGDNLLEATVTDASGKVVAELSRTVHVSGDAVRAVFVPERSVLVADGIHRPMIAVRFFDGSGRPVRDGASGEFTVAAPYAAARLLQDSRTRETLGMDARAQQWQVRGDDGVAMIELEPTGSAGTVKLGFEFKLKGQQKGVHEDVDAWLKATPRDWVVVGFAKGSLGYDTLERNMQALPAGEDGTGVRAEGRAALYAKGRVLGSWLLTMAYDSGKDTGELRDRSLLSTIDPGQYYTLYGDGMGQRYDAASSRKLYLKLERDQFYALFGDFQSGLDHTQLSRYQRALTGVKVEYNGPLLEFNGFAAKTGQNYARDELQGDGTSGLYRMRRRDIVINSERVRIETRDRYHSEQIVQTRELVRHIDYDIDYDNGTLFFREPVASRDFDFNPNWIVVEYETTGTGEQSLNGGGRVAMHALDGRLEAGATYVRDGTDESRTDLAGVDAKFKLTQKDELRAEAAATRNETGGERTTGNAWLVEWEHRGERGNLLAYARRMGADFGLGQQNQFESAMFKTGVQGQYQLDGKFSLQGEAYRQENLTSGAVRDVAHAEMVYRGGDDWTGKAGLQWARDTAEDGTTAESRQATMGATKSFFGGRLDLGFEAEFGLGGKNESVDFPTRLQLNAGYNLTKAFRVIAAQEFTDGKDRDTSTTRFGFQVKPWKDATLTSTLNKSQISEYGPRTFAQFGLDQKVKIGDRWSLDAAVDSSQAFHQGGDTPLVVDPSQPVQAGGIRDGGALTENFVAVSTGLEYRGALWLWNARTEARQSDSSERYGFTTGFLRQIRNGVAFSASAQAFSRSNAGGGTGILASAQASFAYRPMGSEWSMLDKLEFELDEARSGTGDPIIGQDTLAVNGDARSARIINNFVLNRASDAWRSAEGGEGQGSVLDLYQRSQLSLYYGSKYVLDTYDGDDYSGYTDILGAEVRFDLSPRVDVGLRASVLHSWSQHTYAWAFGPSIGFTPFTNAWVSVGYNIRGFNDRDFESSHYTAEGAYLVFRMKFDQHSLGLDRAAMGGNP